MERLVDVPPQPLPGGAFFDSESCETSHSGPEQIGILIEFNGCLVNTAQQTLAALAVGDRRQVSTKLV